MYVICIKLIPPKRAQKWKDPTFFQIRNASSQIGSFPQLGMKIKNIWNHHLAMVHLKSMGFPSSEDHLLFQGVIFRFHGVFMEGT